MNPKWLYMVAAVGQGLFWDQVLEQGLFEYLLVTTSYLVALICCISALGDMAKRKDIHNE